MTTFDTYRTYCGVSVNVKSYINNLNLSNKPALLGIDARGYDDQVH